ncbi:MAG: phenylalanine--tRNA ligase subunit beta [Candidatus Dojkabacteria bacterium]|nr:MAG: phenylalanine--tRNA ligase subunit beta [Candidatus Dojkabacteria bacterium]
MKISLNWIKELTQINLLTEEFVARVRARVGEVEEVIEYDKKYQKTLLAQIKEKQEHPEADKLAIYKLDIGSGTDVQVVAGDKTLEVGDKVAYFPPETAIPYNPKPEEQGNIVKKVKLRGIESNGMIASARELDISNNHERVMRMHTDMAPGTSISEVLEMNDVVIDIENKALANRADCFGIIGIAREAAGIQGLEFKSPDWYLDPTIERPDTASKEGGLALKVDNQADNLCPRYMAAVMSGIQIKESPLWLQSKLVKSGVRPINNIVDITNYIMLLTGQPLHAFDYDKLKAKDTNAKDSAYIIVRRANTGEVITTLDGKTHELNDSNVVICDSSHPVAIGGVMGGLDTEIDENSKNIIIESANFEKSNIRRTSMQFGLFSEAVTRFTKGQDPNKCENALYHAVKMVEELANGQVADKVHDIYQHLSEPRQISVSLVRANTHLGTELSSDEIHQILENVELHNRMLDDDQMIVDIPTYRKDLQIPEDIHEEIGRQYGYDNIQVTLPGRTLMPAAKNPIVEVQKSIRKALTAAGADEILTYNFRGAADFENFNQDIKNAYHIKNALSPELEYMRTSILPSVLEKVKLNSVRGKSHFALFEINKSHSKLNVDKDGLPVEQQSVAFGISMDDKSAKAQYSGSPYYLAKQYLDELMRSLNINRYSYEHLAELQLATLPYWIQNLVPLFNNNATAIVIAEREGEKSYLGIVGDLNPVVKSDNGLAQNSAGFEIEIKELQYINDGVSSYSEPSRYPAVVEDICFIVDNSVPAAYLQQVGAKAVESKELVSNVSILDIYQTDEQKKQEKKQVTISIMLQHKEKTLSGEDVSALVGKVSDKVTKATGGKVK